jgi:diketogulonate reductase-like aldo/keto reductase
MADLEWITTAAGVRMPRIIYGTAWKKERTADLVEKAVLAGFRGIDTAGQPKHYDEPLVGEAIDRLKANGLRREDLFVQTKFTPLSGQDPQSVPYDPHASPESQVAQSFESSQKNLKTDYVDSLVLHSPVSPYSRLLKIWKAMETIHRAGGARQLGISNCYDPQLLRMLHADVAVKPAVVQNRFYAQSGYDADLRHWCSGHGVVYQSFWTLTANPHILASPAVGSLAQQYGKTQAQIFFRFLTQAGIVPLTGTTSERHMHEDLRIFDFELSPAELGQLDVLLQP